MSAITDELDKGAEWLKERVGRNLYSDIPVDYPLHRLMLWRLKVRVSMYRFRVLCFLDDALRPHGYDVWTGPLARWTEWLH